MNIKYLSLSSTNTNQTTNLNTVVLNDHTTTVFNLSGISEMFLPLFLNINWGDGKEDFYDNDILNGRNLILNRFSSLFDQTYSHEYYPSDTTTSESLTAVFKLKYVNGNISTFNVPLSIVNYTYNQSIEDLSLVNTVILPGVKNEKIHQFVTKKDGYLVELKTVKE
jgi:hypothetical protein